MGVYSPLRGQKPSPREQTVLDLLLNGKENKIIAYELGLTEATIKLHLRNLFKKFGVHSRLQLVVKILKSGTHMNNHQMFFFEARIYRSDERYWTIGLQTTAPDLEEASRTFYAWSSGVLIHPKCTRVGLQSVEIGVAPPNRGYQYPNSPVLRTEIQLFLNKDPDDA